MADLAVNSLGQTSRRLPHRDWVIPSRRTVSVDFDFYDPPDIIWHRINERTWPYQFKSDLARTKPENMGEVMSNILEVRERLEARDLALLCTLYLGTFRASEICRVTASAGYNAGMKPSILAKQFVVVEPFLKLRDTITLKRLKYDKPTKTWEPITDFDDRKYRVRGEINFPLKGPLSCFSKAIRKYVDKLGAEDEVYPFNRQRAHQIVNYITGWPPHAFRAQGLKLYSRLLDRNIKDLQRFSGHARLESLAEYLGEGQLEAKLLEGPKEV